MKPYEVLPEEVEYRGETYALDLSYAAFFSAADLLADKRLPDDLKLCGALDLLVVGKHPDDPGLLEAIFELVKDDRPRPDGPTRMDLEQDWSYICGAFQQAYGINLYEDKTIHILRFRALLESLPGSTKLAEIIGIRAAEIPAPNKHNAKQIADLTRLKALYALRGSEHSLQEGWARLFEMLSARAVKVEKNG